MQDEFGRIQPADSVSRRELCKAEDGRRFAPTGTITGRPWYLCQFAWPDGCFVQCGSAGIVLGVAQTVCFFEAFPASPDTFLRAESAKSIADAELKCWEQWLRILQCDRDHTDPLNFEARGLQNGYGYCCGCRLGVPGITPPTHPCRQCGVLTWYAQDIEREFWCQQCYPTRPVELRSQCELQLEADAESYLQKSLNIPPGDQ